MTFLMSRIHWKIFFEQSGSVVYMVLCCVRVMAGKHDLSAIENYL